MGWSGKPSFFTMLDCANHRRINVKLFRKELSRNSSLKRGANCFNCMVRYFAFPVVFSDNVLTSIKRILSVFSFGSWRKVSRINAFWVIA